MQRPSRESGEDSDAELLSNTVFTFKKEVDGTARGQLRPPMPLPVSRGSCRPKHSFETLVTEGSTIGAALADENFWESFYPDPLNGGLEGAKEDDNAANVPQDELKYDITPDKNVDFLREDNETAGATCGYRDCLRKVAKRLIASDHVNIEEAESLLYEGILAEFSREYGENHVLLRQIVTLVQECHRSGSTRDAAAAVRLCECALQSFGGIRTSKAERLWSAWTIKRFLSEIRPGEAQLCSEILKLHSIVLSICASSCYISKDDMAENFLNVLQVTLDKGCVEACWKSLERIMDEIIDWLDVPRIHLIMDWIHGGTGKVIFDHYERPIRLAKLMDKSHLGQLGAKIILDCAIFPTPDGEKRVMNEGDDYEFVTALTNLLVEGYPTTKLDGPKVAELHSVLRMASCRLYYTFLGSKYGEAIDSLLLTCTALRNAVPTAHYQTFIATRDLLGKMEAYLRSFLIRSKHNRGYLGKQMTLPMGL